MVHQEISLMQMLVPLCQYRPEDFRYLFALLKQFFLKIFTSLLSNPCTCLLKIKGPDGENKFHKCQDNFAV